MTFRLSIVCMFAGVASADESAGDAMPESRISVDRRITDEPTYVHSPRYCLLVFGPDAATKVWLVEDGQRLFVDRNANGDLTDDGEPIAADDHQEFRETLVYQAKPFRLDEASLEIQKLTVDRWQRRGEDVHYAVRVTSNGVDQSGGWKPIFKNTPGEACVLHFCGHLRPRPYRRQTLRLFPPRQELSIAFSTPGLGEQFPASLANDAVPETTRPTLTIDWPSSSDSGIRTYHTLSQRQCYWEFTDSITAPDDATTGTAYISVSFPTDLPIMMETHEFEMEVTDRDKRRRRSRWISH